MSENHLSSIVVTENSTVRMKDKEWKKFDFHRNLLFFFMKDKPLLKNSAYRRLFLESWEYLFSYIVEQEGMDVQIKSLTLLLSKLPPLNENDEIFGKEQIDEYLIYRKAIWNKQKQQNS